MSSNLNEINPNIIVINKQNVSQSAVDILRKELPHYTKNMDIMPSFVTKIEKLIKEQERNRIKTLPITKPKVHHGLY